MSHSRGCILVFAKAPVPGACKSRLAAGIGSARAARVYRRMLARVVGEACGAALAPVSLWCSPGIRHSAFVRLRAEHGVTLRTQPAGDLGNRMHGALRTALRDAGHAVLVGSDCPALAAAHLDAALARLDAGDDAVFTPTRDGGYALVGLRRPEARLFRGLPWGGAGVMVGTRRRLRRLGLRWSELTAVDDVDERADYIRARRAGLI